MLRKLTRYWVYSWPHWRRRRTWRGLCAPCRTWASITTTAFTGCRRRAWPRAMDTGSRACPASRIRPSIRRFILRCWLGSGRSIRNFPRICRWRLCSPGCCFRCSLATVWILLREYGFGWRERYLMLLVAALSPVTAVFSFSLMPELLFTALLLASVMLAERSMKPGAGVAGGAGRSLRSAGVSHQVDRAAAVGHGPAVLRAAQALQKGRHVLRVDATCRGGMDRCGVPGAKFRLGRCSS